MAVNANASAFSYFAFAICIEVLWGAAGMHSSFKYDP